MIRMKPMLGLLSGGGLIGLLAGWLIFAPGAPSAIPNAVPDAVAALLEDRCLPFVKNKAFFQPEFDGRGLEPVLTGFEDVGRYTTSDNRITITPRRNDSGSACSISDQYVIWSEADRRDVVDYALSQGPAWVGEDAVRLDLSQPEIPFHVAFRPKAAEGRFLMVHTGPIAGNRDFTSLVVGWGVFEEEIS